MQSVQREARQPSPRFRDSGFRVSGVAFRDETLTGRMQERNIEADGIVDVIPTTHFLRGSCCVFTGRRE